MRRFLFFSWLLILLHTIKDIFQDFLGTDFLYFLDANEDLSILSGQGRTILVLANIIATFLAFLLIFLIPLALQSKRFIKYQKACAALIFAFLIIIIIDLTLDPRIKNPRLFLDPTTRKSATQSNQEYQQVLNNFFRH